jgi:hypothetical protein
MKMSSLAIYERLQAQGKIGPRDELGHARPYQEFPKAVTDANGNTVIVHSSRQQLEVAAKVADISNAAADADPIIAERNRLARENDELRAKLQLLQQDGAQTLSVSPVQVAEQQKKDFLVNAAVAEAVSPPAPTDGLPPGVTLGTPVIKRSA